MTNELNFQNPLQQVITKVNVSFHKKSGLKSLHFFYQNPQPKGWR